MSVREEKLQCILCEVLGVGESEVSATSSFSELGMDSLLGLRFARRLQDAFGVEVEPEWLFDHPRVDQLANFLDQHLGVLEEPVAG